MRISRRIIYSLSVLTLIAQFAYGEMPDYNVVISQANEIYTFFEKDGRVQVKSVEQTEFETTKYGATVVPHVFYNDDISLDKASGGKAQYKNVNSPNIFHDGSKVCFFDLDLGSKGSKGKADFRLTYKDAALFAKILLADNYFVRDKTVKFEFPKSLERIELIDMNFPEGLIERNEMTKPDGARVITYVINNLPPMSNDGASPPLMATSPYIIVKGYFSDLDDLWQFHKDKLDVSTDIPDIDKVIADAVQGATDRHEIIERLYNLVQHKVRYVAYEEGEAGYRPDEPANVLAKNYGDCKGMALLLATLLNHVGVEAYVACVGTSDIPFKIADYPGLAASNHMICIAPSTSDTLYLDATYEYITSTHIPTTIQGKDAMMFKPGGYEMIEVPRLSPDANSESSSFLYDIADGCLMGRGEVVMTGDLGEFAQSRVNDRAQTYKPDVIASIVRPRKKVAVDNSSVEAVAEPRGKYVVRADVSDANGLVDAGDALYVDLSFAQERMLDRVNPQGRREDYQLPLPMKIVRQSQVKIPEGYRLGELPDDYQASCGGVDFACSYRADEEGVVTFVREVKVADPLVRLNDLEKWNTVLSDWYKASARQIEFVKLQ